MEGFGFWFGQYGAMATPWGVVLTGACYAAAVVGFGFMIVTLIRSNCWTAPVTVVMSAPALFISGAVWPTANLHPAVAALAELIPSTHAIRASVAAAQDGALFADILPHCLFLLVLSVVYGLFGLLNLKVIPRTRANWPPTMSFDCLATLMTPFIDSHCHLTDPAFAQDLDAVIGRMKNAGMIAAVTIGCEDRDIEPLRALLDRYPGFLYGAWAVHPEYPDAREADADEIAERASEPGMAAVGETGLDFYWCKEPLDWQRDRFRRHIEAARRAQNRLSSMPAMQKPQRSKFSKRRCRRSRLCNALLLRNT